MLTATRTLHPLPFEHLEPKRFEDLIRQLAYDFRRWRQLEPTGRAGADDGFDARGFEIVESEPTLASDDEDDREEAGSPPSTDRLWLVQCKREKRIGPTDLLKHLNRIAPSSLDGLYGIIFAAPTNFSKKAIDTFRVWCRNNGIQECHLRGHAAIEDLLFQPKNDHLLFAYFGVSLQIRRRSLSVSIRRVVVLKRRLSKLVPHDRFLGTPILLRDIRDERYPDTGGKMLREGRFLWWPCYSIGVGQKGLRIVARSHHAYYKYEDETWDFASGVNEAVPQSHENPWYGAQIDQASQDKERALGVFWRGLPNGKCHICFAVHVAYDEIIEVDEVGDNELKIPTVFVTFRDGRPPFSAGVEVFFVNVDSFSPGPYLNLEGHVRVFPDEYRDLKWESGWFANNQIRYSTELVTISQPTVQRPDD